MLQTEQRTVPDHIMITPLEGTHAASMSAAINGVDRNGILRMALAQPLPEGAAVRLDAGLKYSTTGQVLYSVQSGNIHYVTIQTEPERRREPRTSVAENARVVSMEPHRAPLDCSACVTDVSKSGIGLITKVYVSRDLLIKITLDDAIVFGVVQHCTCLAHDPTCFKVGVEIETVIFRRGDTSSSWEFAVRGLWAALTVARQTFVQQLRPSRRDGY